jgi:thioredoxin reductase
MNDTLEYLINKIGDERNNIADCLVGGNLQDFAQYQFLCGQARGLLAAQVIIQDLASQLEHSDD